MLKVLIPFVREPSIDRSRVLRYAEDPRSLDMRAR